MHRPLLAALAAAALASSVAAAPHHPAALEAQGAWSRPAAAGTTGAGFLTLANRGRVADALVGGESPDAAKVEIHQTRMAGGVMSMSRVDRVPIPAGGRVTLAPGGTHLMLIGLKHALRVGERLPVELSFASGAKLKAEFVVREGASSATSGMSH